MDAAGSGASVAALLALTFGCASGSNDRNGDGSEPGDSAGPVDLSEPGAMVPDDTSAPSWAPGTLAARVCPSGALPADPVPDGAAVETVCTGLDFAEGAVWFGDSERLFFSNFGVNSASDDFDGSIVAYSEAGGCTDFVQNAGTNGLAIGLDGNIVGCRHLDRTLTRFDIASGAAEPLVSDFEGARFSSPNDVTVRSDGNIYFTDPAYQLGNRSEELPQSAYRLDPAGALGVVEVLDGQRPNGITLSPDETLLYLAVMSANQVRVYDVDAKGATSNGRVFIDGATSDGMAIDCAGNLYLTGRGGVNIYGPDGGLRDSIAVANASNLAFGGPKRTTLFITAGSELRRIELHIPGLPY